MNRFAVRLLHALMGVFSSIWAWAPLGVLVLLSASYLLDIRDEILKPGNDLTYQYLSPSGPVTLRAHNFYWEPDRLRFYANRISATGPDGRSIAQIESLNLEYKNSAIQVLGKGLRASIVRGSDGKIDLAKFLPETKGPKSALAYAVVLRDSAVQYRDLSLPNVPTREIRADTLRVDATADQFVARASLSSVGIGVIPIRVQGMRKNLDASVRFSGNDLAVLIPYLRPLIPTKDVPNWDARRLTVSGNLEIQRSSTGKILMDGLLDAKGDGIFVQDYVKQGTISASARISGSAARGQLSSVEPGRTTSFDGLLDWDEGFTLAGKTSARVSSQSKIWKILNDTLPKELSLTATDWTGDIRLNRKQQFFASGEATSQRAYWDKEEIKNPRVEILYDDEAFTLRANQATWMNLPVTGFIQIQNRSGVIAGQIQSNDGQFDVLAARFGIPALSGHGTLAGVISGTTKEPVLSAIAKGIAGWDPTADSRTVNLGPFQAAATIKGDIVKVTRLAIDGPNGTITGAGSVDLKSKMISGAFSVGALELEPFRKDLSGLAFGSGILRGTLTNPEALGSLQLFGTSFKQKQIPALTTNWSISKGIVSAKDIEAALGAAKASGELTWNSKTDVVSGHLAASNVQVSEFLGSQIAGSADLDHFVISGTLADPKAEGSVMAKELVSQGVALQNFTAQVIADSKQIQLNRLVALIDKGSIQGDATVQFESGEATIHAKTKGVPISKLPFKDLPVALDGSLDGQLDIVANKEGILRSNSDLKIEDFSINQSLLGSGQVQVKSLADEWTGSGTLGQLSRYLQVDQAKYNAKSRIIDANFESLNFSVKNLIDIFKKSINGESRTIRQALQSADGLMTANVGIHGSVDEPDVSIKTLDFTDLVVANRDAGKLSALAERKAGKWTIDQFDWTDGPISLKASGWIEEHGQLALKSEITNLDLSWLRTIDPELPNLIGSIDLSAQASGATDNPNVIGSLTTNAFGILSDNSNAPPINLQILAERIEVKDKKLSGDGAVSYQDFTARFEGSAPLTAFLGHPVESGVKEPITAKLTLEPRKLTDLLKSVSGLDLKRTEGLLGGSITLSQDESGLMVNGEVGTKNAQVGVTGLDTLFLDTNAATIFRGNKVEIRADTQSADGGSAKFSVESDLPDFLSQFPNLTDLLTQLAIDGSAELTDFKVVQNRYSRVSRSVATLNGSATVSGSAGSPIVGGAITADGIDALIPTEFESKGRKRDLAVNPVFKDLRFSTAPGTVAKIRAGSSTLEMLGDIDVSGSLSAPIVKGNFELEKGSLSLANVRVSLDPGGRIFLNYDGSRPDDPQTRLDVNVTGQTSLTTRSFGDNIERYDIVLAVNGNLLRENGLSINATSDPPDLSPDQIRSLLGQRNLIEALNSRSLTEGSQARDILYGYAFPALTDPLTRNFAEMFKLDYVNLEYNQLEGAVFSAGKTLARGLTIFGRRQLSAPVFGVPRYELKLVYRPPVSNRFLSRIRFGIGLDQDRPWKISVEYNVRF